MKTIAQVINDKADAKARLARTSPQPVFSDDGTDQSWGGGAYTLPQATGTTLGGIVAAEKTTETAEVKIDAATGKLYAPAAGEAANGVAAGGTAGQVYTKIDGTDYNAEWADALSGAEEPIYFQGSFTAKTGSDFVMAFDAARTVSNGLTIDNSIAKITIQTAGKYLAYGHQLQSGSAGYFEVRKNGVVAHYSYVNGSTSDEHVSYIFDCAVDDYIDFHIKGAISAAWPNPHSSVHVHKL